MQIVSLEMEKPFYFEKKEVAVHPWLANIEPIVNYI